MQKTKLKQNKNEKYEKKNPNKTKLNEKKKEKQMVLCDIFD